MPHPLPHLTLPGHAPRVVSAIVSDGARFQFLLLSGATLATSPVYVASSDGEPGADGTCGTARFGQGTHGDVVLQMVAWAVALGALDAFHTPA